MATFHTTGMVLRVSSSGEDDRRASIYTIDHGKLDVFAKSARRMQSKLSPHLEPATLVDCYIARGRADHLAGIERTERFPILRQSLPQLANALWAAELVDVLTRPDHPDPRIFHLLEMWFLLVETLEDGLMPEVCRFMFVMCLFHYLGYGPECDQCVRCKIAASGEWLFSAGDGGLVCQTCRLHAAPGSIIITQEDQVVLCGLANLPHPEFNSDCLLSPKLAALLTPRLLAQALDRPLAVDIFLAELSRQNA